MSAPKFITHRKDEEMVRIDILTNICRMMIARGHLDLRKYCFDGINEIEVDGNIVAADLDEIEYRWSVLIDNEKLRKIIGERSEKNIYKIKMDKGFADERVDANTFDSTSLVVCLLSHKITDIKKSDMINDVFKTYPNAHKIFVGKQIEDKAKRELRVIPNVEVFAEHRLMIDLMSHEGAPHRVLRFKGSGGVYNINPNIGRIHLNDPLAIYFNAKFGDTLEIIRNTVTNCYAMAYRTVIESKDGAFGK